jgi:hypothetical protein
MSQKQRTPQTVPREYAGKWVAWTKDAMRIAGVGDTPQEAKAAAEKAGVSEIAYEWVPPAEHFIGSGRRRSQSAASEPGIGARSYFK